MDDTNEDTCVPCELEGVDDDIGVYMFLCKHRATERGFIPSSIDDIQTYTTNKRSKYVSPSAEMTFADPNDSSVGPVEQLYTINEIQHSNSYSSLYYETIEHETNPNMTIGGETTVDTQGMWTLREHN